LIKIDSRKGHPNIIFKKWRDVWFRLRGRLVKEVEVVDEDRRYRFRCGTLREYSRCVKMFVKEPGTCDWIKSEVKPGETFYDIGANIGVYTVLAAGQTGNSGKVFAFEPHSANFSRLLDNILVNDLQDIVVPCNFALHEEEGFFPFNYVSSRAGYSSSQLTSNAASADTELYPEIAELKYAASVDSLVASEKFSPPHHVKIDVDGNEWLILRGMNNLFESAAAPKSLQVELDKRYKKDILHFMEHKGYVLSEQHYTRAVQKRIAAGENPEDYTCNGIFQHRG
jgi:FkbM family methyltransferase